MTDFTSTAPRISVEIPGHGRYSAPANLVDVIVAQHLPASALMLRRIVAERAPETDWSNVVDVSAFVIVLADWLEGEWINEAGAQRIARQLEPVKVGARVRFTSPRFVGRKYGTVMSWATQHGETRAVVNIPDGTAYEVPLTDLVEVDATGLTRTPQDGDLIRYEHPDHGDVLYYVHHIDAATGAIWATDPNGESFEARRVMIPADQAGRVTVVADADPTGEPLDLPAGPPPSSEPADR